MRNNQKNANTKTCPFLDGKCIKSNCDIYNEKLEKCEIGLLNYNIYMLTTAIRQQMELQN